jgi:hypothetical protein
MRGVVLTSARAEYSTEGTGICRFQKHNMRAKPRTGHMLSTGVPNRLIRVDLKLVPAIETQSVRFARQWEGWPKAGKLGDNHLKPLEERVETAEFRQARQLRSAWPLTMAACVSKMSDHNLIGRYPPKARVIERPRYRIE